MYSLISQCISLHQNGFFAGKLTITNLECFTTYVVDLLASDYQVGVILMDFSNVFDKVDQWILIRKLTILPLG